MGWLRDIIVGDSPDERVPAEPAPDTTRAWEAVAPTEEDRLWGRPSGLGIEEDFYWRRLSDNWYQKDVVPSTYLELHNRCYEAYNANPIATAIVDMTTNFVVSDEVGVEAESPKVQQVLDEFWRDPDNHMDTRVHALCTELSLYGEQFIRFFVNPFTGRVKIAQIDPSLIDQIETDPDNVERPLRFHQRPVGPGGALWSATAPPDGVQPPAPVMEPAAAGMPGDQVMAGTWYAAGTEVLQFKINAVSNAKRGKSDLATLLPWLRRYQEWLIDRVRINKYKSAFLWDVKLDGADAKTIDRKRMQYAYAPMPGSVVVHNESETWTAVQPRIDAADAAADGLAIKLMIAAGAGLPEHYLGEGGDVNRSTAAEMGLPTFRKLSRRQHYVRTMLHAILDRVLDEAQRAGRLGPRANRTYRIALPELTPGQEEADANTAALLMRSLTTAQAMGYMSRQTAMRLLYAVLDPTVNTEDELARVLADLRDPDLPAGAPIALSTGGMAEPLGSGQPAQASAAGASSGLPDRAPARSTRRPHAKAPLKPHEPGS